MKAPIKLLEGNILVKNIQFFDEVPPVIAKQVLIMMEEILKEKKPAASKKEIAERVLLEYWGENDSRAHDPDLIDLLLKFGNNI